MKISGGEEKLSESIFKVVMIKRFPNLGKEIVRSKRPKRSQIRQYIVSVKAKERILKTAREKIYQVNHHETIG